MFKKKKIKGKYCKSPSYLQFLDTLCPQINSAWASCLILVGDKQFLIPQRSEFGQLCGGGCAAAVGADCPVPGAGTYGAAGGGTTQGGWWC